MMKFQLSFERLNGQKVVTIDATTSYEIGLFSSIIIDTKDEIYIFDFSLSYFYNWLQKRDFIQFCGLVVLWETQPDYMLSIVYHY